MWQWDPCSHPIQPEPTLDEVSKSFWQNHIITNSTLLLNSSQIPLWSQWSKTRISNWVQYLGVVHSMWWNLLKRKWNPVLSFIPQFLSRTGRLCLPHLSAQWNICQHLPHHHRYRLPRNPVRLHWVEGWQLWAISTDGKILREQQHLSDNNSKPLEDQVKKEAGRQEWNSTTSNC